MGNTVGSVRTHGAVIDGFATAIATGMENCRQDPAGFISCPAQKDEVGGEDEGVGQSVEVGTGDFFAQVDVKLKWQAETEACVMFSSGQLVVLDGSGGRLSSTGGSWETNPDLGPAAAANQWHTLVMWRRDGQFRAKLNGTVILDLPMPESISSIQVRPQSNLLSVRHLCFSNGIESICRFAPSFNWGDLLLTNTAAQDQYVQMMLTWDGRFAALGQAVTKAGLTRDHIHLNADGSYQKPATYTAASKESLHVSMLALIAIRTPMAWHWIAEAVDEETAVQLAIERLTKIIASYEDFNAKFPGCGGFIPWVGVGDTGFTASPNDGFKESGEDTVKIPGLDNGQLAWAFVAAGTALEEAGQPELARRYWDYVDVMAASAKALFYNPSNGSVYSIAAVPHTREPFSPENRVGTGCLHDLCEGELLIMFMDLMSPWDDDAQREAMWAEPRKDVCPMEFNPEGLPNGPITVLRGWRFSSHEVWKFMVLPYLQQPLAARVFANCEKARTWNSHLKGIPGLLASCYKADMKYSDCQGIPSIAKGFPMLEDSKLMVTPYAAFPLILADRAFGLAWHCAMLCRPKMQCRLGSVEAVEALNPNPKTALTNSWDTKVTSDLAALGGTGALLQRYLCRYPEKLQRFADLCATNYAAFETMNGEDTPFAPPPELPTAEASEEPGPEVDLPRSQRLAPCVPLQC